MEYANTNALVARRASVVTSDWTVSEVPSALSIKRRQGDLSDAGRAAAERAFDRMVDRRLDVVPLGTADLRRAADHVRPVQWNLRARGALPLAVTAALGRTLQSLDEVQVAAAGQLGIDAEITGPRGSG